MLELQLEEEQETALKKYKQKAKKSETLLHEISHNRKKKLFEQSQKYLELLKNIREEQAEYDNRTEDLLIRKEFQITLARKNRESFISERKRRLHTINQTKAEKADQNKEFIDPEAIHQEKQLKSNERIIK